MPSRHAVLLLLVTAGVVDAFSVPPVHSLCHSCRGANIAQRFGRATAIGMTGPLPAWANGEISEGWRGDPKLREEAEEAFRTQCPPRAFTVNSDPALWDENEFVQYTGSWSLSGFDRVVQLPTYMALKFAAKLVVANPGGDRFTVTDNGMSNMADDWVVFGYINSRSRVVKSIEGSSFGLWYVQTLEPDATSSSLKYEMMPSTGSGYMLEYEKQGS
jgi:hypothetical protein